MKNESYNYLYIEKNSSSMGSYDDGVFIKFDPKTPGHISYEMYTDDPDIETCDFRLTTIYNTTNITTNATTNSSTNATAKTNTTAKVTFPARGNFTKVPWMDVVFFRFGYFNYQKLNLVSMVNKFTNGTWYKIDLIFDWPGQTVTSYVNNTQLASDKFFTNSKTKIPNANAIVLYNLTPGGRCRVRNLKVCEDRCDGKFITF
jgi:hypothetical protein